MLLFVSKFQRHVHTSITTEELILLRFKIAFGALSSRVLIRQIPVALVTKTTVGERSV